ncbi:MAG: helix-turn-helix transcriptional regulator [Candidatus Woesearchaeota archaeon]
MAKKTIIEFKGFLSFLILHELNKKNLSGDELATLIGIRKGSRLTPGTIYPTLKRLKKLKLLIMKRDGRKKYYKLTKLGQYELKKLYGAFSNYFYGFKKHIKKRNINKKHK